MNEPVIQLARFAIYARKWSEHNLDLAFNSLDAQREACVLIFADITNRVSAATAQPRVLEDGRASYQTLRPRSMTPPRHCIAGCVHCAEVSGSPREPIGVPRARRGGMVKGGLPAIQSRY